MTLFFTLLLVHNGVGMLSLQEYHICLECEKEFKNDLNLAICPECLEKAKEKYKQGIFSEYETVNIYLRENKDK